MSESTPLDTTVLNSLLAEDINAGVDGLFEYFIVEKTSKYTTEVASDSFGTFEIVLPHQIQISLAKSLDYSKVLLTVVASERGTLDDAGHK